MREDSHSPGIWDIITDPRASIVQLDLTRVVGAPGQGFASQMIQVAVQQLELRTDAKA